MALISETIIQHHATHDSLSRGEQYYRQGSVIELVQRGRMIQAAVEGGQVAPYRVRLQYDSGGITSVRCTCPYDYEGWCKHIVAAALTYVRQPDRIEIRPTLAQLLDQLDHLQTQRLVQALVEEQPDLIEAIDRRVMLLVHPAPSATAPRRRTSLDVAPIKPQVRHILREGLRSLEEGYEEDPFSDRLLEVIDKAQEFSENEDSRSNYDSLRGRMGRD
jgi:uncharacterized Zn finger protein